MIRYTMSLIQGWKGYIPGDNYIISLNDLLCVGPIIVWADNWEKGRNYHLMVVPIGSSHIM